MNTQKTLQSVRGMNDILPPESLLWEKIENVLKRRLALYDFLPIRLPIVEPTPLFSRAIGEVTDIVEKEMYSFVDALNDEKLTLRPEGTAGCVRAFIQNKMGADGAIQKLYYLARFATSVRKKGVIGNFISWAWNVWASAPLWWMPKSSRFRQIFGRILKFQRPNCISILWAILKNGKRIAQRLWIISRVMKTCWMTIPNAVCVKTRCVFWILKILI